MATAIPLPVHKGPRYLPKKLKERELKARMQDRLRKQAEFEAREIAKFETFDYLNNFLQNSEWRDLADSVTIAWEDLPTLKVLYTYAALDKVEGTRACRKLFKAAVIWDDLGCSLWKWLNNAAARNRNVILEDNEWSLESDHDNEYTSSEVHLPNLARSPSKSSHMSRGSSSSSRSRQSSTERHEHTLEKSNTSIFRGRHHHKSPVRRSTDPASMAGTIDNHCKKGFPRILSDNVKKTMGAFGESMIQGHGARGGPY